jgi:hypothetical protein
MEKFLKVASRLAIVSDRIKRQKQELTQDLLTAAASGQSTTWSKYYRKISAELIGVGTGNL